MEILKFDILRKDELVTRVEYNYKTHELKKENFNTSLLHGQLLGECTFDDVLVWFEYRCFPRTRANCDELLKELGLKTYMPLLIVMKTHGVMYSDDLWIRFEGEDLTYSDVSVRT